MKRKRQQDDDLESLMAETLDPASQKRRAAFLASVLSASSESGAPLTTQRKERKELRQQRTERKVGPRYFQGKFVGMEILQPQINDDHFVWSEVAVRPSVGRKFGLFATKALPAYTILPYFGLVIAEDAYNEKFIKLVEDHNYDEYMLGSQGIIIDGSPALYPYPPGIESEQAERDTKQPQIGMLGLSIAAFSNEPFATETANSSLVGDHTIPLGLPAIITLEPIKAGQEILTCYNRHRDYPSSCPASVEVPKLLENVFDEERANIEQWNELYRKSYYNFPEVIS